MTTLATSAADDPAAAAGRQLHTVQCDVCCPPFVATNTLPNLLDTNWMLRSAGADRDVCPVCRRRKVVSELVSRTDAVLRQEFPPGALPNLVIIGAAKCGTTSLHAYLDRHPEIAMSTVKEPQFFSDPDCAEWQPYYESLFDATAPVRGESSTMYTRAPAIPGVARRMAAAVPDARLIYMVRDPVERALASFVEEKMHDNDRRTLEEAFADLDDPFNPYVAASRYAQRLTEYIDAFDGVPWLVIEMEDLATEPQVVLDRVCTFLGIGPYPSFDDPVFLNTRASKRAYPSLARRLRATGALRALYRLPERQREALLRPARRLLARRIQTPQPSPALRGAIEEQLRADAARFRELTGQTFARWSI